MTTLVILIIIIGIFEVRTMLKNNQKREIGVFMGLVLITLIIGYVYMANPHGESIAGMILNVMGIER